MTHRLRHLWPGVSYALASAALFGVSTPVAKALLAGISPAMLAGLFYLGSGLGLFVIFRMQARGDSSGEARLQRADVAWLAAAVATGGCLGPLLLMTGLAATSASAASLVLNLEGVFTLSIAWVVFREHVDLRVGVGAAAILLAALLLSGAGGAQFNWRSIAIVCACLAWGIDNNLTRKISGVNPMQLAMLKGLAAGTMNLALARAFGESWPKPALLVTAGAVGFVAYGVSLVCFILALRHLGTARTGAYFSFAPFVGAATSILALGDPVTPTFLVAAGLMAGGLYLHLSERHEHIHVHGLMGHEHRHVHDDHHRHPHAQGDPPGGPHTHWHEHARLIHSHPHYPDIHHRHEH